MRTSTQRIYVLVAFVCSVVGIIICWKLGVAASEATKKAFDAQHSKEEVHYTASLGEQYEELETCVTTRMLSDMTKDMRKDGFDVRLSTSLRNSVTYYYIAAPNAAEAHRICRWVTEHWGWHRCDVVVRSYEAPRGQE
jgi:hypothetical protein